MGTISSILNKDAEKVKVLILGVEGSGKRSLLERFQAAVNSDNEDSTRVFELNQSAIGEKGELSIHKGSYKNITFKS